tara:strand:- start:60191 stop:60541 length:351 start_codon:yes stop_codon:yes gene_type:complete
MDRNDFRPLFTFANHKIMVIEIQRLDLEIDAAKGCIYHWLLINKAERSVEPLGFKSMQSLEGGEERRQFDQTSMIFNALGAEFTDRDDTISKLSNISDVLLDDEMRDVIALHFMHS